MIGGEGEEPPKWSGDPTVQIMQFAAQFGATVFDLEHRFFGESRPMKWVIELDRILAVIADACIQTSYQFMLHLKN